MTDKCGHTTQSGIGTTLTCGKPENHKGWHEQKDQLRDGPMRTNWGDDGKAIHASSDEARRRDGWR